jgi:hypothetical protein
LEGRLNYHEEKSVLELKDNHLKIYDLTLPVEGQIASAFTSPRLNLSLRGYECRGESNFSDIIGLRIRSARDRDVRSNGSLNERHWTVE